MGVARQIVLAENEAEAKRAAQRAYRPWRTHIELLWKHSIACRFASRFSTAHRASQATTQGIGKMAIDAINPHTVRHSKLNPLPRNVR